MFCPQVKKLVWAKLKSPFSRAGRSPMENSNKLSNRLSVNEEYKEAFRTKSYIELWSKVQGQLRRISIDGVNDRPSSSSSTEVQSQKRKTSTDGVDRISSSSSSSSSPRFNIHLSDYLFEPQQLETLKEMMESLKLHHLLIDYFQASLDSGNICEVLLRSIHQTRANYGRIKRVIKLSERVQDSADYADNIFDAIFGELAAFALLKNPLSFVSPVLFLEIHDNNVALLHRLSSEQRKIRRRVKFNRISKKVAGCSLVISHTAIVIALLVIAIHSLVGIVAAPGLVGCSLCLLRKKIKSIHGGRKTSLLERLGSQLNLAAKGTYILINHFDTLSRLVIRLYDEIEHWKALADMCVRNKKIELLKEVLREFYMRESCYLEQIEELERHTYLCFNTINKSRSLVIQEIMVAS